MPAGRPKPPSGPARSLVGTNFQRAVAASVADTRRQWDDFKAELRSHWGAKRANLMICALTRDDPMKDCTGRKLGIVVDSSGSNQDTDPGNLRITAAQSFNAGLVTEAQAGPDERPDLSTVIDFDDSARVISPLADPAQASFAGIDSEGGTDIGSGVNAAIGELTKDGEGETKDRTGIVVLTDGLDGGSSLPGALAQAASLGIRVNFGFLSPPANPVPAATRASAARGERPIGRAAQSGSDQPPELVRAILATGGFYGVIDSAESQRKFVDLVLAHGATALDDPNGLDDGGALIPGVRATGLLGAGEVDTWSYAPAPGRHVTVTATSRDGSPLVVRVHDVRRGVGAAEAGGNPASATARVRGRTDLEIRVSGATGLYTVEVAERGTELRGTPGADRLRCTDEPTYVTAGAGRDRVRCGGDADLIVGGRGADRLRGAGGDDVFLIRRGALRRGIERISGGAGHDEVDFGFRRPRTVQCAVGRRTVVGLGRARFLVTGVERLTFQGRPCGRVRRAP